MADAKAQLAPKVRTGDVRAASRLIRLIEDENPSAVAELRALFRRDVQVPVIGITGSPGSGKSTLTDRLISNYRSAGKAVGVIAVDPSSPYSGGAILGDRVRMQRHSGDAKVFIRSLATRGHLGGLARAAVGSLRVMEAWGSDVVLIETVGVGQDEVDVAQLAHTTVVVAVPGLGDDIQAIKAGILEIADIFAVNKSDLDGADKVVRDLRAALDLKRPMRPREHDAQHLSKDAKQEEASAATSEWEPKIEKVSASRNEGIDRLVEAIDAHWEYLQSSGGIQDRERERGRSMFLSVLRERLLASAIAALNARGQSVDAIALQIATKTLDPFALIEELGKSLVFKLPRA